MKPYERSYQRYWYAYHPSWDGFLESGKDGYLILGCMDLNSAFAIPSSVLADVLSDLNTRTKKNGSNIGIFNLLTEVMVNTNWFT